MPTTTSAPPAPVAATRHERLAAITRLAMRHRWTLAFGIAAVAIAAFRLAALGQVPPGLDSDEASIGYNAWAIAHHGVDEHGAVMPLYFQAYDEFKNPIYIYLLAPFTWILPLTSTTIRLPAALCGLVATGALTLFAWRTTRNRAATLLTLVTAAFTPWLVIESRVGLEVIVEVTALSGALLCLARGLDTPSRRGWLWAAGGLLGLSVLAYTTARLFIGLLVVVLALVDRRWRPSRELLPVHAPVVAVYALLGLYAATGHAEALVHRFGQLWIGSDEAGVLVLAARFARNYATYLGFPFLFTHGDASLRQNPGDGGMLLVAMLPALALGVWAWWRRRDVLATFVLCGLLVAPVPAALTADGTPQALRSAAKLPFLVAITVLGWAEIVRLLVSRRALIVVASAALAFNVGGFAWDFMVRYPNRTVVDAQTFGARTISTLETFEAGELDAVQRAHDLADGHRVWLSDAIYQAGEQALVAFTPAPRSTGSSAGDRAAELDEIGMSEEHDAGAITPLARPCDVLVLGASETPPAGATELLAETWTLQPDAETLTPGRSVTTVRVWRNPCLGP